MGVEKEINRHRTSKSQIFVSSVRWTEKVSEKVDTVTVPKKINHDNVSSPTSTSSFLFLASELLCLTFVYFRFDLRFLRYCAYGVLKDLGGFDPS